VARIGDNTVYIGSPDWYIGDPLAYAPTGVINPELAQYASGDTARIDASGSADTDPDGDTLFYEWSLPGAPPSSAKRLRIQDEGLSALLTLDVLGPYFVEVIVSGANGGAAPNRIAAIVAQPAIAPYDSQQVYSVSWLWDYLPDVWRQLSRTDRLKIETFWRGMQQIVASDVMQVLNTKDALSIATIQDRVYSKWVRLPTRVDLPGAEIFLQEPSTHIISEIDTNRSTLRVSNSDKIGVRRAFQSAATLLNPYTLVFADTNMREMDLACEIVIVVDGAQYITRARELTQVADRVAAVLLLPIAALPRDAYPYDVSAIVRDTVSVPQGLIVQDGRAAEIQYAAGQDIFIYKGQPLVEGAATRGLQVRAPGALAMGVSAGDILHYTIEDTTGAMFAGYADITAIAGDYLSISPQQSIEEIITAMLGAALSDEDVDAYNNILADVTSQRWRNRFFNTWIGAGAELDVCFGTSYARSVRIAATAVTRRSVISLPENVVSLFRLTERTEKALITGATLLTEGLEEVEITRAPLDLFENLDFYIRDYADAGTGLFSDGSGRLSTDRYNFTRSGVRPGHILRVTTGAHAGSYEITSVSDAAVVVANAPPAFSGASFEVVGNMLGKSVVFSAPIPPDVQALWAETAIISNDDVLEAQFGSLAGLRLEEWVTRGLTNSYKDAVMGLYYARMQASTVGQLENAVSIMSGVPFAPHASRIAEIDDAYEVDSGSQPKTIRVVLEELDVNGFGTQRYSAHTFPSATDTTNPDLSGIGINRETGARYAVGDVLSQFTAIALGTKVSDIYNSAGLLDDVYDRHRFRITIDVDAASIRGTAQVAFIHDFVVEIKPAYVHFLLTLSKFLVDTIDIEEDVTLRLRQMFFDNPYHLRGPANILDDASPSLNRNDLPAAAPLTTWFPTDGLFTFGTQSALLVSATGGFVNPSPKFKNLILWPQPWIRAGDIVVLRQRRLHLRVERVVSDNILELVPVSALPAEVVNTQRGPERFFVGRYRTDVIYDASVSTITSDDRLPIHVVGDTANDIGAGDLITLDSPTTDSAPLRVLGVDREALGGANIFTYPARPLNQLSTVTVRAFRERITDRELYRGLLVTTRTINGLTSIYRAADLGVSLRALGVEPGDILRTPHRPDRRIVCVTAEDIVAAPPVPREDMLGEITIIKPAGTSVGDNLDEHEHAVGSATELMVKGLRANLCRSVIRVDFPLRVGDIVYFHGATFDHGEGAGISRVKAILNNGQCAYGTGRDTLRDAPVTIIRQAPLRWMYYTAQDEVPRYGKWATQHWS
jgi:hypothetical protein